MLRQLTKTVAVATRTSIRGRCCSTHFPPPFSLFFFFNEKSVDCSFSRCQKKKKNVNATRWGAWLISLSPSHSRTGNGARQQGAPYSCHHFQSLGFGFSMRLEVSWTVYVICYSFFFFWLCGVVSILFAPCTVQRFVDGAACTSTYVYFSSTLKQPALSMEQRSYLQQQSSFCLEQLSWTWLPWFFSPSETTRAQHAVCAFCRLWQRSGAFGRFFRGWLSGLDMALSRLEMANLPSDKQKWERGRRGGKVPQSNESSPLSRRVRQTAHLVIFPIAVFHRHHLLSSPPPPSALKSHNKSGATRGRFVRKRMPRCLFLPPTPRRKEKIS